MFERSLIALGLIALMAAPVPALAGTITFFSAPTGNTVLGASLTYAIDGVTITATAGNHGGGIADFSTVTLTNENLVNNNRGAGQQGLGVCLHECTGNNGDINFPNELIQLNVTALDAVAGKFSFSAGGATGGAELAIYGSDASGSLGTKLADITDAEGLVEVANASSYDYLNFIAANGDGSGVLLLSMDPVPEPASLAMLCVGLVGIAAARRRGFAA